MVMSLRLDLLILDGSFNRLLGVLYGLTHTSGIFIIVSQDGLVLKRLLRLSQEKYWSGCGLSIPEKPSGIKNLLQLRNALALKIVIWLKRLLKLQSFNFCLLI